VKVFGFFITLILITGCGLSKDTQLTSQAKSASNIPQDQYAEVNGVRLHYLDWGGDGPLMLMVSGRLHTAHTYNAIASSFTDRYRVVAVTRREHGASRKNTGVISRDVLAKDLSEFISLFSNDPTILVGQSFAGVEMPVLARKHPEKVAALIFLDAVYDWPMWATGEEPAFPTLAGTI
jgi:pimeloyl-ACP methyl ester carboxylesterase